MQKMGYILKMNKKCEVMWILFTDIWMNAMIKAGCFKKKREVNASECVVRNFFALWTSFM